MTIPPYPTYEVPASPSAQSAATGAVAFGWQKFTQNWRTWILAMLVCFLLAITIVGVLFIGPAARRGALLEIDGHQPRVRDFFKNVNWGPAVVAEILVYILPMVPIVLLGIPVVVVVRYLGEIAGGIALVAFVLVSLIASTAIMFFSYLTPYFVVDRRCGPIAAVKASAEITRSNAKPFLLLALLNQAILIVGTFACYVGLLAAYPIVLVSAAYAFRVALNGPVPVLGSARRDA
jgi:uncharacterized membrane protein